MLEGGKNEMKRSRGKAKRDPVFWKATAFLRKDDVEFCVVCGKVRPWKGSFLCKRCWGRYRAGEFDEFVSMKDYAAREMPLDDSLRAMLVVRTNNECGILAELKRRFGVAWTTGGVRMIDYMKRDENMQRKGVDNVKVPVLPEAVGNGGTTGVGGSGIEGETGEVLDVRGTQAEAARSERGGDAECAGGGGQVGNGATGVRGAVEPPVPDLSEHRKWLETLRKPE